MYDIGDDELAALKNVFDKKRLYRYNPNGDTECDLFEKEFSSHFGTGFSLLLSSGTNALLAGLTALGLKEGDEVLVPAYTFVATINAVLLTGATPVVVNNDAELGYDLNDLKGKITEKTKAIILVHMDGLVSNVAEVKEACEKRSLFLIEDVAQAMGASFNGKKLGTFGQVGCFSLNENKVLSCGEGGILITDDRTLYEKSFCAHDTPSQFSPSRKTLYQNITPFTGHSMRVSEIQGAIMRVQLKKLDSILFRLKERKDIYRQQLANKLIKGYDETGENNTGLLLKFGSVQEAADAARKLLVLNLQVYPIISRPAHVAWKWHHLINQKLPHVKYNILHFSQSIELLSSVLKIDVDINKSIEETHEAALQISSCLK